MSRHRNVRTMDYTDDYEGYDDVYGHSVDDECGSISPTDAQQWMFDREKGAQSISEFIKTHRDIVEEDEDEDSEQFRRQRRDSEVFHIDTLELSEMDRAKLVSCLEEIHNVVGESFSDRYLTDIVLKQQFDVEKCLDVVLNNPEPKPVAVKPISVAKAEPSISVTKASGSTDKDLGPKQTEKKVLDVQTPLATKLKLKESDFATVKSGNLTPLMQSPAASGRNSPDLGQLEREKAKKNARELYDKERELFNKDKVNVIVIGHVDAGKSTLMGNLLYSTGYVAKKVMQKNEQESKKLGKQSFAFAWVLDETEEERQRGITMDVGQARFETPTKNVTLLDAPGHKDFIPNMISGAYYSDCALLVVDATRGEFESGFDLGGQTREHALLVKSLGVSQLAVVINKMDTVSWSKVRFDEIVAKLKLFLFKQVGFKSDEVIFIPCSGITGENLTKKVETPQLKEWYNGKTLIEVIDSLKPPARPVEKPFRMSVSDVFKKPSGSGICIAGRIITGYISLGEKLSVGPTRETAKVKEILGEEEMKVKEAFAGDLISLNLTPETIAQNIKPGTILSEIANPCKLGKRVLCKVIFFNLKFPITKGVQLICHYHNLIEPCAIKRIKQELNKMSAGEVIKKNPKFLKNNSFGLVELEFQRNINLETFEDFKEMGRMLLRMGGTTVGAGLIEKINDENR